MCQVVVSSYKDEAQNIFFLGWQKEHDNLVNFFSVLFEVNHDSLHGDPSYLHKNKQWNLITFFQ
jgi:hypothetical protein